MGFIKLNKCWTIKSEKLFNKVDGALHGTSSHCFLLTLAVANLEEIPGCQELRRFFFFFFCFLSWVLLLNCLYYNIITLSPRPVTFLRAVGNLRELSRIFLFDYLWSEWRDFSQTNFACLWTSSMCNITQLILGTSWTLDRLNSGA